MNTEELNRVLSWIDSEFYTQASKMTVEEKTQRARHWREELGAYPFSAVMEAVRKQSGSGFVPRTSQIREELRGKVYLTDYKHRGKPVCRIIRTEDGEICEYTSETMKIISPFDRLPEWLRIKFRWMAEPTEENTAAWDAWIRQHETLMTMETA